VGQWYEAILCTFAAVHVNHHALTVDIADFQMQRFLQAQPAGVHGGEKGVVVRGAHTAK
jgi:hypothetical protein